MNCLKNEQRWCVRDTDKKPYMDVDKSGKANDQRTWISFEHAGELLENYPDRFAGSGLYLGQIEDRSLCLCGIDIDSIGHDVNSPNPLAESILSQFRGTYAEKSPSGSGYHIICYIDTNELGFRKENYPFYENNRDIGLEVYVGTVTNRYFTYTGEKLQEHPEEVTEQTDHVLWLLHTYMVRAAKNSRKKRTLHRTIQSSDENPATQIDIEKRLDVIRSSEHGEKFAKLFDDGETTGYRSASEADFALLALLVPWLEGDAVAIDNAYRLSALYKNGRGDKWDRQCGDSTYGRLSINTAIEVVDDPYFSDKPDYATGDEISPEDIVRTINEVQQDNQVNDKISVLPYACGLGKSTAISYLIADVLHKQSTDGLIVATDSLERMDEYAAPKNEKLKALQEYLDLHKDQISVMDAKNARYEMDRQKNCKILIMTTQRLIKQLSTKQIQSFTSWSKGKRPLIIIDEHPGLFETVELNIKSFSTVQDALANLELGEGSEEEYDWCVSQWDSVYNKFRRIIREYTTGKIGKAYHFKFIAQEQMTDDDERFMDFIYSYKNQLLDENELDVVMAAQSMFTGWSIVQVSTGEKKKITFNVCVDHSKKLMASEAKVVVLDGTAELDPEYDRDCFDVRTGPMYRRWLDRLSIKLLDYPSTKDTLKSMKADALAKGLHDYAWRINKGVDNRSVIFTYKCTEELPLEEELKRWFNTNAASCNVDHFGAIRGHNTYKDANLILQIGLNRFPNTAYMLYYVYNSPAVLKSLREMDSIQASEQLDRIEKSAQVNRIRAQMLLADVEQNLFRGVIRDKLLSEDMQFHIFCKLERNKDLLYLMQLRFWPLHADITTQGIPKELNGTSARKNKGPELFREWLCAREKCFTLTIAAKETGIKKETLMAIISRNEDIKKELKKWDTKSRERVTEEIKYCKKRLYRKKINRNK